MKIFRANWSACCFALICLSPATATAGVYADEMAKCLVESTSERDRLELVRWMFSAASRHPAVASVGSVTEEQLDAANKGVAELFMELMTESCRSETEKALQYEGALTIQTAFSVLGQVAGQELFASPEVAAAMAGLEQYLDTEELKQLTGIE